MLVHAQTNMMRVGSLVNIPGYTRKGVVLLVSQKDINNGTNVRKPGLYIFSGYWYGTNPLSHKSYGKIHGQVGKRVGTVRNHQQIAKLCK